MVNGAGYNPEHEDVPYNLYEKEESSPYDDQGWDEDDDSIESTNQEIKLSTVEKQGMLQ